MEKVIPHHKPVIKERIVSKGEGIIMTDCKEYERLTLIRPP